MAFFGFAGGVTFAGLTGAAFPLGASSFSAAASSSASSSAVNMCPLAIRSRSSSRAESSSAAAAADDDDDADGLVAFAGAEVPAVGFAGGALVGGGSSSSAAARAAQVRPLSACARWPSVRAARPEPSPSRVEAFSWSISPAAAKKRVAKAHTHELRFTGRKRMDHKHAGRIGAGENVPVSMWPVAILSRSSSIETCPSAPRKSRQLGIFSSTLELSYFSACYLALPPDGPDLATCCLAACKDAALPAFRGGSRRQYLSRFRRCSSLRSLQAPPSPEPPLLEPPCWSRLCWSRLCRRRLRWSLSAGRPSFSAAASSSASSSAVNMCPLAVVHPARPEPNHRPLLLLLMMMMLMACCFRGRGGACGWLCRRCLGRRRLVFFCCSLEQRLSAVSMCPLAIRSRSSSRAESSALPTGLG